MTGFTLNASALVRGLNAEKARRAAMALEEGRKLAARMEADAKTAAPWRDRSGLARRSISARAERSGGKVCIELTGGAPYSAALETRGSGRYAVLGPTVRRFAPEYLDKIAREEMI